MIKDNVNDPKKIKETFFLMDGKEKSLLNIIFKSRFLYLLLVLF